jgi:hypothetical protein
VTFILERPYLLAQDLRVEERFGFDGHLSGDRVFGGGEKPSGFLVSRVKADGRTPNIE